MSEAVFDKPRASAAGDAGQEGTATAFARSDHVHEREAFATTTDIADVAATESAGSAATVPRGDHVHALPGLAAWSSYAVAWQGTITNPVVGDGTLNGYYAQFGKTVHVRIELTIGSTTTFGSGTYQWTVPVTSKILAGAGGNPGSAVCFDTSAGTRFFRHLFQATNAVVRVVDAAGAAATPTVPFTWEVGDSLAIHFTYEAA